MRSIYLDYNATTPVAPSVTEVMLPFLTEHFGNPSSSHALGRACQESIEDARGMVATLLDAERDEIIFTSGGTESNNLALQGTMLRHAPSVVGHLVISAIEHPSVAQTACYLEKLGGDVTTVGCDAQGRVAPDAIADALRHDTTLVSVMHANNETGVIQPISEIADICHAHNTLLHVDAAQSVGKISTSVEQLGVDLLSLAGHKFYGPKGIGALYIRRGVQLEPILQGGGQESGLRSGTENVSQIVGLGQAALLAHRGLKESVPQLRRLRDVLTTSLRDVVGDRMLVFGSEADRLPNTLMFSFLDVAAQDLLARVPEICASHGSACHSGRLGVSPTLAAMGVDAQVARGSIRLSLGWSTSEEEVQRAAELLLGAWEALR